MRLRRRQWLPVGPVLRMHTVHKYVIRHECVLDCKKCSAVVKKVKANILWWALPGYVNKAVNICCRCDSLCLFLSEAFTPRCCRLSHIKAEVNKIACYPVSDWGHTGPKEKLPQIRVKVNIDTCKGLKRKPPPITEGGIFLEGFMSRFFYISILYFSKFQLLWESCTECVWRVGGGGGLGCCPCLLPRLAVEVDRRPHRLLKSARCASRCCAHSDEHPGCAWRCCLMRYWLPIEGMDFLIWLHGSVRGAERPERMERERRRPWKSEADVIFWLGAYVLSGL